MRTRSCWRTGRCCPAVRARLRPVPIQWHRGRGNACASWPPLNRGGHRTLTSWPTCRRGVMRPVPPVLLAPVALLAGTWEPWERRAPATGRQTACVPAGGGSSCFPDAKQAPLWGGLRAANTPLDTVDTAFPILP